METIKAKDYMKRGSGITDLTVNGECAKCGECCTDILPMDYNEVAKIRKYVQANHIKQQDHHVRPGEVDCTCPFLNLDTKKCMIYPVRPKICREFLCSKSPAEIEAMREKKLRMGEIMSMRLTIFGDESQLRLMEIAMIQYNKGNRY